jgi:hypothetical protein
MQNSPRHQDRDQKRGEEQVDAQSCFRQPRLAIDRESVESGREEHGCDPNGRHRSRADDAAWEQQGDGRDEGTDCHDAEGAVLVGLLRGRFRVILGGH